MNSVEAHERAYPWIKWRVPIKVNDRYACRICIARVGLSGADVSSLPRTKREIQAHIAREHTGRKR